MGGGSGDMASAMAQQSQASIETARVQAASEERMSDKQSNQAIATAKIDQETRLKEAQINADVKMAELKVRDKESQRDFKVAWKEAQNDAARVEVSKMSVDVQRDKAATGQYKAETQRDRYSDRNRNDYFGYG